MSWDGYIDSIVDGSQGSITEATIIGLNGAMWTPDSSKPKILNISAAEALAIGTEMAKKNETVGNKFAASGITVAGERYMFLRDIMNDGRIITAKKKGLGSLTMQSTNQAILIAFTPEAQSHGMGNASAQVDKIAKYLEGLSY